MKPLDPANEVSRAEWNEALAKFVWPIPPDPTLHSVPPDFLAGLRPDGTCDEAQVDWALWGKLLRAFPGNRRVFFVRIGDEYEAWRGYDPIYFHAHPVAALALCAEDAGLLEEKCMALAAAGRLKREEAT